MESRLVVVCVLVACLEPFPRLAHRILRCISLVLLVHHVAESSPITGGPPIPGGIPCCGNPENPGGCPYWAGGAIEEDVSSSAFKLLRQKIA